MNDQMTFRTIVVIIQIFHNAGFTN